MSNKFQFNSENVLSISVKIYILHIFQSFQQYYDNIGSQSSYTIKKINFKTTVFLSALLN